jgi:hypothetical protein
MRGLLLPLLAAVLAGCNGSVATSPQTAAPAPVVTGAAGGTEPGPTSSPATPTALPSSQLTAVPSIAVTWQHFTSKRFAFAIDIPEGWAVTSATADWPGTGWPDPFGHAVDRFQPVPIERRQLTISSDVLKAGELASARRGEIDQENVLACTISRKGTVTIDGDMAQREDEFCFEKDHLIDVFVAHAGRIYLIDWLSSSEIDDSERALVDAILGRMTFTS